MIYRMRDLRGGRYPRGRSTIYRDMGVGLLTPAVRLGPRCVGWPSHEIDQIISARTAGASDDDIRLLVARLIAERPSPTPDSDTTTGADTYTDLRRACHRVADAAIATDDAFGARDPDALRRAIDALAASGDAVRALAARVIRDMAP
jgi:prophage regulatory protein